MPKTKEYDVFISFAEPDRSLAKKLHDLFTAVDLTSFFAPKTLPKKGPQDWEKSIFKKGLKQSRCFVPIFTKQSLNRKWVLFETGAAVAINLKIFAATVKGVDQNDLKDFPYANRLIHYKLYDLDKLRELIKNIGGDGEPFLNKLDVVFKERRKLICDLLCEAREQWVFIAGNIPKDTSGDKTMLADEIGLFVRHLSSNLFRAGFNLSACPQVESVGRVVLDASEVFMAEEEDGSTDGCEVDYEIAGIYPIDKEVRTTHIANEKIKNRWHRHLIEFRRSYLINKDWLVIVGGNEGTTDEFEVVREINDAAFQGIKVCFIPYFGGAAKTLNERRSVTKHPHLYFNGCEGWREQEGEEGLKKLAANVATLIRTH